jgi:hypothetical protein
MFDPARDVDTGHRSFYMRLGFILSTGVVAAAALLLAQHA